MPRRETLEAVRAEWLSVMLRTDPADRSAAQRAIAEVYRWQGVPVPRFVWADSPVTGRIAVELLGPLGARPVRWMDLERSVNRTTVVGLAGGMFGISPPRVDYPNFLVPYRGWRPADFYRTTPARIADHDLLRRIGLVRYRGAAAGLLDLLVTAARSCGWWWLFPEVSVLVERPARLDLEWVDGWPRPHNAEGPAIEYRDGLVRYAWHGILVAENVIAGVATAADWLDEENVEVRRAIAERMGYAWLLDQCDATRVATDEFGTLWRIPAPEGAIVLVDVVNSTPEPDGSFRRYVLRVPPDQTVPCDAIGWTFGLRPGAYGPTAMS